MFKGGERGWLVCKSNEALAHTLQTQKRENPSPFKALVTKSLEKKLFLPKLRAALFQL